MKIKGINRLKLIELRDDIDLIIEITEEFRDISAATDEETIRTLYLELGNINEIIVALNASDFKIRTNRGYRNYKASDISSILESDDCTDLGKISKKFYYYNKSKCGWKSLITLIKSIKGAQDEHC
ncbi:hypothetical protein EZV73_26690 [Acidaminobacter sp. JC074]|uniref:hypothetical protein n=1 Tax=Acidaminobacter sp. JC074 TaxID=2530199 RepID=UPI001F0D4D26|nr:hypothetical protein [Acidaminobacter sp. JC074]MCH4891195.1 hypothetical protein [Acidaminobacter sp. JC074]